MLQANHWYRAKINQYGAGKTKTDTPYVWVQFAVMVENNPEPHMVRWSGTFGSGPAKERTINGLIKLGLKGNDVSKVAEGTLGGALDQNVEYSVTLELGREYNGKQNWEVKGIGRTTPKKFEDAMTLNHLKGLTADVMAARKKLGEPSKPDPKTGAGF
jgi:hypothetical protein